MRTHDCDVAVVGGGPAGMAAALAAARAGAERVVLIERDLELGGILPQCIHNGFGLHRFGEELTGPQYASRFRREVEATPAVEVLLDTTVLEVTPAKTIWTVSPHAGISQIKAKAVVFAMGCRERTRGAIGITGDRPAGVFTAGMAQRMVNREGCLPGKKIVILGSGDIGLIMARRLTLEGADVRAVLELMPHPSGLTRNIVQCLEDFAIPLHLSHTVTAVHGRDRVQAVTCAAVDDKLKPVPGTEFILDCDCLLLSVGLIPENELSKGCGISLDRRTSGPLVDQTRQTSLPGFFAAGNVLHVHDLVDWVSHEGDIAGRAAARFAGNRRSDSGNGISIAAGDGIRYVVPQLFRPQDGGGEFDLYTRVINPVRNVRLTVTAADGRSLYERRLAIAKPSEMVALSIPADRLTAAGSGGVTVALRQDRQD